MILQIPNLKMPSLGVAKKKPVATKKDKKRVRIAPQIGMQTDMLKSPAEEILMGGEAGGGKSWAILFSALEDIDKFPALRILILRRTAPNLGRLIEMALEMYLPLGFKFSSMDREYKKPTFTHKNGAKIIFGHMQHEKDKHNYQGMEFQRLHFDEVTHFSESQYLYLFSRVRSSSKNGQFIQARVVNSANPDGEGVEWVKRRWIDKLPAYKIGAFKRQGTRDLEFPIGTSGTLTRQWIPCIRAENLFQDNEAYEKMLSQMTPEQQNALRYGIWKSLDKKGQLIRGEWLDRALSGEIKYTGAGSSIGIDPAEQGQDRAVIISGTGNQVQEIYFEEKSDVLELGAKAVEYLKKFGYYKTKIGVDTVGIGSGTFSKILELTKSEVHPNFYRANKKNPLYDEKMIGKVKFKTIRAQMYHQLMEDFKNGQIDLSPLMGTEENQYLDGFEEIDLLREELLFLTYTTDEGHFQVIEKKILRDEKHLGRSPDFADALAIWNWVRNKELNYSRIDEENYPKLDYGDPFYELEQETSENEFDNANLWA